MEVVGVLDNVRSLHNVGSIFRTADGLGVTKLYLTGQTGHPHPSAPWRRDHLRLHKTALGAEQTVAWEYHHDLRSVISELKNQQFGIIALEKNPRATPLHEFTTIAQRTALIVGSEVDGISDQVLAMSDAVVSIPMVGQKESFNVSVSFAIAAYHLLFIQR